MMLRDKQIFNVWLSLTSACLILSLAIETYSLYVYFGATVWAAAGIVVSLSKTFYGFFYMRDTKIFYLFIFATMVFANLESLDHLLKAKGNDLSFQQELDYVNKTIKTYELDLQSIDKEIQNLSVNYGSVRLRESTREKLTVRKEKVIEEIKVLEKQKLKLTKSSDPAISLILGKIFVTLFIESSIILSVRYYRERNKVYLTLKEFSKDLSLQLDDLKDDALAKLKEVFKSEDSSIPQQINDMSIFNPSSQAIFLKLGIITNIKGKFYTNNKKVIELLEKNISVEPR